MEGEARRLLHFFICNPVASIINNQISLCNSSTKSVEGAIYSYCDVLNYLLATYATDDLIAEAVKELAEHADAL